MQNLGQLGDWETLLKGEQFVVPATASQWSTIAVNAPTKAALYYWPLKADGTYDKREVPAFLALVEGLDEIRFASTIGLVIEADGEIAIRTNAGLEIRPSQAGESFARIVERRPVSPEVAAVISRANANQRAMMRQMNTILANQQAIFADKLAATSPKPVPKETNVDEHQGTSDSASAKASRGKGADVDGKPPVEKPAKGGEGDAAGS